jgi:hypothetical protein
MWTKKDGLYRPFCLLRANLFGMLDNDVMKKINFVASMLTAKVVALTILGLLSSQVTAQSAQATSMFRCNGNTYTNMPSDMVGKSCKPVEGNLTTVHGTRVFGVEPVRVASLTPKATSAGSSGQRTDSAEQKTRDSDSRGILEAELRKAEAKQAELLKEYKNGEPDINALDIKNPQRYVDRVAELKANIARNDSDITGIKRELGRNQGSTARVN